MTHEEKESPEILEKETARIARIAKGSGVSTSDVRSLLKQYKMLGDMVKSRGAMSPEGISQKQMQKMMKKFGRKMKF